MTLRAFLVAGTLAGGLVLSPGCDPEFVATSGSPASGTPTATRRVARHGCIPYPLVG